MTKIDIRGLEIDRREDGIRITERVHFSPYPRDTRFLHGTILPSDPAFGGTDNEVADAWLEREDRKARLAEGAPA